MSSNQSGSPPSQLNVGSKSTLVSPSSGSGSLGVFGTLLLPTLFSAVSGKLDNCLSDGYSLLWKAV